MPNDFIRFSSTEVINTERLATYIANGIAPGGGTTFDIEPCEGLSEVVLPDGVFTTPLGDEPPWYDANDPDTWDFAGVLPLEVTGLDDTTRSVTMTPTIRGNGLAGRAIRGPQTIGVTAVLVGRTTEGVAAGLAWLRRVLHGACDADELPCGPTGTLETFTVCPVFGGTPDLDAPATTILLDPNSLGGGEWLVINGTFTDDAAPGTHLRPYGDTDLIDGGDALADEMLDVIDGGGAFPVEDLIIGDDADLSGTAVLGGTLRDCVSGPVTITWTLREGETFPGPTVRFVLLDAANQVTLVGPDVVLTDTDAEYVWELPLGVEGEAWRPALITTQSIIVTSVETLTYAAADPLDCVAPYRRFFPVTATTYGPIVTETIDTDCVELLKVEWTWESGSPYRYGVTEPVLLGMGFGVEPTLVAPGVVYDEGDGVTLTDATPWNCAPPAPVASCAIDPAAPGIGVPPSYPVVVDTTRPRITTEDVRDMWTVVGPELIPSNEGVFTMDLTAGPTPVVGVRVRVWDDSDALGVVPELCDFAYEFLIDYIPANGVLTIDGPAGTITTLCDGNVTPQDAAAGVRGAFGGPIQDPVVRCDRRYLVRVQWLDTYPRDALPFYEMGDQNGTLSFDLAITNREG